MQNQQKNNAVYWAMAREYAPMVLYPHEGRTIAEEDNPASLILTVKNQVAVIAIRGELGKETFISSLSGHIYRLGHDLIRLAIETALAEPQIKAILLSIDSPGGIVAGTKELADFIAEAAKVKPMAAYADGLMASAAYWLGAATGRIFAPATALVGSIGVIMRLEDWSAYYLKAGVQIEYIASGAFKAAGQEGKELTEAERAYFAAQLAELHAIFKQDVKSRMAITADETLWAEAQLMPATQAQPLGLVTALVSDQKEAVRKLAQNTEEKMDLATLKAEHPDLVTALLAENQASAQEASQKAAQSQQENILEIVKVIAGEDVKAKVEQVVKSGITATQLFVIAPLFKLREERESQPEDAQAKMLASLQAATGAPVTQAGQPKPVNRLLADAEKRSKA